VLWQVVAESTRRGAGTRELMEAEKVSSSVSDLNLRAHSTAYGPVGLISALPFVVNPTADGRP
jgi:hypothetical protein